MHEDEDEDDGDEEGASKPVGRLALSSGTGEVPKSFSLSQNLPNPFNPSTMIRYTLANAVDVRLTIYNALGQKVCVLVSVTQAPGVHSVQWNGRDRFGRFVSSGLYLYKLEAGENVAVRKMIFIK